MTPVDWLTCPCGKRRYHTRSAARRIARRLRHNGVMTPYRCPDYPNDGWHLGHHPDALAHGEISKDVWLARIDKARRKGTA